MRKLKVYRIVLFAGKAVWVVTLAGFSILFASAQMPSGLYHPNAPTLHEYYDIIPGSNPEGPQAIIPSTDQEAASTQPKALSIPHESGFINAASPTSQPILPAAAKTSSQSLPVAAESGPLNAASVTVIQPTQLSPSTPTPTVSPSPRSLFPLGPETGPLNAASYTPPPPKTAPTPVHIQPVIPLNPELGPLNAASTAPVTQENRRKETYNINYNNIGMIEYIRFISKISNTNFVFQESDLQFNVTIVSEEPTSIDDIMSALIQILRIHGLSLSEQGNNIIIYQNAELSRMAPVVTDESPFSTSPIITRVIRLSYIAPEKARSIVQPMLSAQALIEVSPETRHLIVTDIATNIDKVIQLLHSIDQPNNSIEVATYFTQYTAATNLIGIANRILDPIALANGTHVTLVAQPATNTIFIVASPDIVNRALSVLQALDKPSTQEGAPMPRSSAIEVGSYIAQNVTPSALIPLAERILMPIAKAENALLTLVQQPTTNSIFVISTPDMIQRSIMVLRQLDQSNLTYNPNLPPPPPPDIPPQDIEGTVLYLYKLQYLKGDKIEEALQEIGGSLARSGLANPELISTINSMQWVEPNNSLLFVGTPTSIEKVKEFLRTLDRPLRQVFLEMLVIQTSLFNSLTFGVEWAVKGQDGVTFFGSSGLFAQNSQLAPNFTFPQTVNTPGVGNVSLPANQGFNFGVIGNIIRHNGNVFASIGALLQALQTESQTKIILNPKIVTEDNNTAQVFVGQNIPYTTANVQIQAANNSTGFNVDYRDVGVLLEITPLIGSTDMVTLDIHQEINTLAPVNTQITNGNNIPNQIQGFPIPTTNKILTTTRVHVPHGYFIILSGMIQDQKSYTKSGIPCLGCMPVLGAAFSQQNAQAIKQNIVIFIHPKIIDTRQDIANITDEQGCDFEQKSRPDFGCHKSCPQMINDWHFDHYDFYQDKNDYVPPNCLPCP